MSTIPATVRSSLPLPKNSAISRIVAEYLKERGYLNAGRQIEGRIVFLLALKWGMW